MFTDMLQDILMCYGPSGRERRVGELIRSYVAPYADETYFDAMDNLIAVKRGTSGKRVMLSAHMDQIGFIALGADESGFIRVSNVGGINAAISIARRVIFGNGVVGITAKKGYFDLPATGRTSREWNIHDLVIDVGASTREEAEALVPIGEIAVYLTQFTTLGGRFSCGALDNRLSCAIVAEAFINAKSNHDVYAVFTVQEEVGLRGAGVAAYAINPDLAINLDVTLTGDTPHAFPMAVKLGGGPTVKIKDSSVLCQPVVIAFMESVAKEAGIPYQREVLHAGGTDTASIQKTAGGYLAGCISVPTRYVHTPVETADMEDSLNAVKLVLACIAKDELPKRG